MRRVGFCYRSPSTGLRGAIRRSNADGFLDFMSCTCLICPGAEDRLAGDIRPVSAWLFDQSECGDGRCGMPQADKREGRQVRGTLVKWAGGVCSSKSRILYNSGSLSKARLRPPAVTRDID